MVSHNQFSNNAHKQKLISMGYDIVDLNYLALSKDDYVRYLIVSKTDKGLIYTQCPIVSDNYIVLDKLSEAIEESLTLHSLSYKYDSKFLQFVKKQVFNKTLYTHNKFFRYDKFDFDELSITLCYEYLNTDNFLLNFESIDLKKYLFNNIKFLGD